MPEGLDIYTDRKVYSIPDGLNELMYDISKEVLRCQPKNLYGFISEYLITMLKVREAVKVAVPILEMDFKQAESQSNFLEKYNLSKEKGDHLATIIQAAYRGYRTRKMLLHLVDEFNKVDHSSATDDTVDYKDPIFEILKTRGITKDQTLAAITKIQAFYRGYKVRRLEEEKGVECLVKGIPSHESWRHDWLNEFAVKESSFQELPWRKSFSDFHKNYSQKRQGDRMHLETIFGGKYQDYNLVCDETSCQVLETPTKLDIEELALPGTIETSSSDFTDVPGAIIMQEHMKQKLSLTPVVYPPSMEHEMILDNFTPHVATQLFDDIQTETEGSVKEDSKTRLTDSEHTMSKHSLSSNKSSASKGSKKSVTSKKLKTASITPELTVKSLDETSEIEETKSSKTSIYERTSETSSRKLSVSSIKERSRSQVSRKSTDSARKVSKASLGVTGKTSVISTSSIKSNVAKEDNTVDGNKSETDTPQNLDPVYDDEQLIE